MAHHDWDEKTPESSEETVSYSRLSSRMLGVQYVIGAVVIGEVVLILASYCSLIASMIVVDFVTDVGSLCKNVKAD